MRCLSLLILLLIPSSAIAQWSPQVGAEKVGMLDYSKRLSVLAIGRYDFAYASEKADPTLDPGKEFAAGVQASYLLSPAMSLDVGSIYALDTKQMRSWVSVGIPFYGAKRLPLPEVH